MCFMVNKGYLDMLYEVTRNNYTIKFFSLFIFLEQTFLIDSKLNRIDKTLSKTYTICLSVIGGIQSVKNIT